MKDYNAKLFSTNQNAYNLSVPSSPRNFFATYFSGLNRRVKSGQHGPQSKHLTEYKISELNLSKKCLIVVSEQAWNSETLI